MINKSKQHLRSVHEDYFTHFAFSAKIALMCLAAGFALITHALIPAVFQWTGSGIIRKMNVLITERRQVLDGRANR